MSTAQSSVASSLFSSDRGLRNNHSSQQKFLKDHIPDFVK